MTRATHQQRDATGTWRTWHRPGWDVAAGQRALLAAGCGQADFRLQGTLAMSGRNIWWKGRRVTPRTARRYAWRAALTGRPFPRVVEWHNLRWLQRHLFHVPRPLAAGVWLARGRVQAQWLATETLEGWIPWEQEWDQLGPSAQKQRVHRLAHTVARMHALGFVHADLFERNWMVQPERPEGPIALLDAWAGGPGGLRRSAAYDLACCSMAWPVAWSPDLQAHFLTSYRTGRQQQGRPLRHWEAFLRKVQAARAARWKREAHRGERYGSEAYQDWQPPTL